MGIPDIHITKIKLDKYFTRYPAKNKYISCVGEQEKLSREIAILCENFSFEFKKSDQIADCYIACLLIAIPDCSQEYLKSIISKHIGVPLVIIHADESCRSATLFAILESYGYRIYYENFSVTIFHEPHVSIDVISTGHRLGDPEIREKLTASSRRIRNLSEETNADLLSAAGHELLTPERFDIAIKCHYARLYNSGRARQWREYTYYEHILRITGPGKNISEYDGTGKQGIYNYLAAFHRLLEDKNPEQIPWVPVDKHHIAFDGAHRIAASIANQRTVQCVRLDAVSQCRGDSKFFSGVSHGHPPCPEVILDEAALEYCRIKDGMTLALIFPSVASETMAIDCLTDVGQIVYRKEIILSPYAGGNLLRQIYLGHAWLQDNGDDSGFLYKQRSCFPFTGVLRVVLLDRISQRRLRPTKERIRAAYGIGNHSIHITDSDEETLRVARVVFNHNSIELLRMGTGDLPGFHQKLFNYRNWLEVNGLDEEAFCIDGSAVLALLGLRECRDLDFLYDGDSKVLPARPREIDCHNELERYHDHGISDITGDPRLHCWYMGVKFCTPQMVCQMKQQRNESKDRKDVILLKSKLQTSRFIWGDRLSWKALKVWNYLCAHSILMIHKIKARLRQIVNMIRQQ